MATHRQHEACSKVRFETAIPRKTLVRAAYVVVYQTMLYPLTQVLGVARQARFKQGRA